MTLESWKEEFYPQYPIESMTKMQAIKHSIIKWTGLRKENLSRHDLQVDNEGDIKYKGDYFFIDGGSCALCVKYFSKIHPSCENCPLYKLLGNSCDAPTVSSPFNIWQDREDPEPMIAALQKLLE